MTVFVERDGDLWTVTHIGKKMYQHHRKLPAREEGRRLAKRNHTELIIKRMDGEIQKRIDYAVMT